MEFSLETNLLDLPYRILSLLAQSMDSDETWPKLFNDDRDSSYYLSPEDVERFRRMREPGAHLLRHLGHRGQTVKGLLTRLHALAKIYGTQMDKPQLLLRRKFCAVIWSRPEQVLVSEVDGGNELRLQCKATGFPTPHYQWIEGDQEIEGEGTSCLFIRRCPCTARSNTFRCKVWNIVEECHEWSAFYRSPGKDFQSELISDYIDLEPYVSDVNPNCSNCKKSNLENIYRIVNMGINGENDEADNYQMTTMMTEEIVAADKVALIISNRTYAPLMANLITPHCDAESLADALQQMKFKTVTLGDLRLDEMKFIIQEYRKLLGEGVYAVFYFVGHGFEANGQCYLLPIGAPGEDYGPEDCLSMDWVMSIFKDYNPGLNLILLDICRKFLPTNLEAFNKYAERFRQVTKVNRNTVYGYATSGGVGAYEVKGEINGVFMKYLKKRIQQRLPVIDMLNKVFKDIDKDKKVRDVQVPELRSNITKPRSLVDPLSYQGHTQSYDYHTMHWRLMHELPNPIHTTFAELGLTVTVWFDFCGHFTNKVYVFSSVGDMCLNESNDQEDEAKAPSAKALSHLAYLKFPEEIEASAPRICSDDAEGVSLCIMLSNLQRSKGELSCVVDLRAQKNLDIVASKEIRFDHVLITRLTASP